MNPGADTVRRTGPGGASNTNVPSGFPGTNGVQSEGASVRQAMTVELARGAPLNEETARPETTPSATRRIAPTSSCWPAPRTMDRYVSLNPGAVATRT